MFRRRLQGILAVGVLAMTGAAASAQAPFISEVLADAPGADQGQEYIEISGVPGTPLNGLFVLVIDGDGANAGLVTLVVPLNGLSLGANGVLLIRDTAGVLLPPPEAGTNVVIRDFTPDIQNGSQTYVLMQGPVPPVGTDLDTNNDGVLDGQLPGVLDAVAVLEAGVGVEQTYADDVGGVTIPQQTWTPDAIFRLLDDSGFPAGLPLNSWAALDVVGTLPGPYVADPAETFGLAGFVEIDISQFVVTPGRLNVFFQRGACCVPGGTCATTIRFLCAGQFFAGLSCVPNPCQLPTTGACCNFVGGCTITTSTACFGNFFLGLSCAVAPCFAPPTIVNVLPTNPEPFETIVIDGTGFGNNPDNLCAVVGFPDGTLVPIDVFEAQPGQIRGILGPIPDDLVNVPGQVMVMGGEGARGPFRPAFFDIFVEEPNDTWAWRQDNPNQVAVAPAPIVIRPTPPRPMVSYIYGRVADGKLCIFLDPNNPWMTNSKITIWNRLHGTQNGTDFRFRDLKTCVRFRLPNNTLACAQRLCDVMRCAFGQQVPPVIVNCQVIPLPDGRIKIEVGLPNGVITNGTLTICIQKSAMVPTGPRGWPVTPFGGAGINPLPLPIVTGVDPNGAGFTVEGFPNNGLRGVDIEMVGLQLTGGRGLDLAAWGRAGGQEDQLLGVARLMPNQVDSFFDIFTDFSSLGGTDTRVVALNGTSVVADYVVPSGMVGRIVDLDFIVRGCGKVPPRIPPIWCFWIGPFEPILFVTPSGGLPMAITELRLLAVNPLQPIEAMRQYDVGFNNPTNMPPMNVQLTSIDNFPICIADFNGNGQVEVQDLFDFLNEWFGGNLAADVDNDGMLEVQDIFDYLNAFFAGCP